ncbi:hypothetical protein F2P81_001074 [Scophthalmus maximus]|uniref:Uncharacterized protein n=1 Tax=Scophthalmus maximus TaxID=52904 RepID=A0A6A4TY76_SCOMX|nr:hypothetical protein F2P81_001074 [Scophthalmus maximus]
MFCRARILTLGSVVEYTGPALDNTAALAAKLNVRSVRIVRRLLEIWKPSLTAHELLMLKDYSDGFIVPKVNDPFPCLAVRPGFNDTEGFIPVHNSRVFNLDEAKGKLMYRMMVVCLNKAELNERVEAPWRGHLHLGAEVTPARSSLYRPPPTQLINFLGQAKMAIYVNRRKINDSVDIDPKLLLIRMIKARVMIDFNYYRVMVDIDEFSRKWTYGDALCSVRENQLLFPVNLV